LPVSPPKQEAMSLMLRWFQPSGLIAALCYFLIGLFS
jgi:hypothetical protein